MATSQNGWTVFTSASSLASFPWVTGRVRPGDVYEIFDYLCRRFDSEVEKIVVAHSWGYAFRAVRGQTSGFSNHASATAIDLNAPNHGLGSVGTFSSKQAATIRRILADLDGVVRWGGDYSGRKDEMHFEINDDAAAVAVVARRLRGEEDYLMTDEGKKKLADLDKRLKAVEAWQARNENRDDNQQARLDRQRRAIDKPKK